MHEFDEERKWCSLDAVSGCTSDLSSFSLLSRNRFFIYMLMLWFHTFLNIHEAWLLPVWLEDIYANDHCHYMEAFSISWGWYINWLIWIFDFASFIRFSFSIVIIIFRSYSHEVTGPSAVLHAAVVEIHLKLFDIECMVQWNETISSKLNT